MIWEKRGLIYRPDGSLWWAKSHAMTPTPFLLNDDVIRIYVAFLDEEKVGRIGFVDVESGNPSNILGISKEPALDIGIPGTFDDNGVVPSSVIEHAGLNYLYYYGFQLGVKVRYFIFSGLAISKDRGNLFSRFSQSPILDRNSEELFVRSAPSIVHESDLWRMWYVSGNQWVDIANKHVPKYCIRHTISSDGINWGENMPTVCIDSKDEDEFGFGRPFVIKGGNSYRIFYSIRSSSKGYRLGYAESNDGIIWKRKDEQLGIDVSESGWDSEMICFSSILKVGDKTYMFYNGNGFGESGFGYAVLEDS